MFSQNSHKNVFKYYVVIVEHFLVIDPFLFLPPNFTIQDIAGSVALLDLLIQKFGSGDLFRVLNIFIVYIYHMFHQYNYYLTFIVLLNVFNIKHITKQLLLGSNLINARDMFSRNLFLARQIIEKFLASNFRDHSFSTYAELSEKETSLTFSYTRVRVRIRG